MVYLRNRVSLLGVRTSRASMALLDYDCGRLYHNLPHRSRIGRPWRTRNKLFISILIMVLPLSWMLLGVLALGSYLRLRERVRRLWHIRSAPLRLRIIRYDGVIFARPRGSAISGDDRGLNKSRGWRGERSTDHLRRDDARWNYMRLGHLHG
jgi:hypothetical protein